MTQAGCAGRHIQRVAGCSRPATPEPRWRGRAATATTPAMLQELNNWAVMNLSMEDRGLLNKELQAPAGSRYLSGDIRCGRGWAAMVVGGGRRGAVRAGGHARMRARSTAQRPPQGGSGRARAGAHPSFAAPAGPARTPTRAPPLPPKQLLWRWLQERGFLPGPHCQGRNMPARQRHRARAVHPRCAGEVGRRGRGDKGAWRRRMCWPVHSQGRSYWCRSRRALRMC